MEEVLSGEELSPQILFAGGSQMYQGQRFFLLIIGLLQNTNFLRQ
jgi:hypothetical protein